MLTIEYRATYSGKIIQANMATDEPETEIIRVTARDLNSGLRKALNVALVPLGNGQRRQITSIEFWQVV